MKALLVIDVQDEYMKKYDENLLARINLGVDGCACVAATAANEER